jgi:hypothetical protein
MQISAHTGLGQLEVRTTSRRGFTPAEIADKAVQKILFVGENLHPAIKEQAIAYQDQIRVILEYYIKEAIKSDRTTLINLLNSSGHPELIPLLEI